MESNDGNQILHDPDLDVVEGSPDSMDGVSQRRSIIFGSRAIAPVPAPAPAPPTQRSGEVLKVSTRSRPSAVAGAIAGVIRESGIAEVQSIGAGATNQAIKAVAIARSYLLEEGLEIVCVPSFIDVSIDDEERTAIRLVVLRYEK